MKKIWTLETLQAEALKYNTRKELRAAQPEVRTAARRRGWWDLICAHMVEKKRVVWTEAELRAEAQKYDSKLDFIKGAKGAAGAARTMGIFDEICQHMGARTIWSLELAEATAKLYDSVGDFIDNENSCYVVAQRNGWWEQISSHMSRENRLKIDFDLAKKTALQFTTRGEFQKQERSIYLTAWKHGWLDVVCEHMTPAVMGFDKTRPHIVYYVKFHSVTAGVLYKIGITSYDVVARFKGEGLRPELITFWAYKTGKEALEHEKQIKGQYSEFLYRGDAILRKTRNTELFTCDILNLDHQIAA